MKCFALFPVGSNWLSVRLKGEEKHICSFLFWLKSVCVCVSVSLFVSYSK